MPDETVRGGADNVPVIGDLIGGTNFIQRVKLDAGGDGLSAPVTASTPLPVIQTGTMPLPTGAATEATLDARTGALTESAPTTDTNSSGINGRLQRIAQRITSLIALLPGALGAGGGLKVDGSGTPLPVSGTVTSNAGTNLNTSALALDATLAAQSAKLPATLGQKAMAASLPVVLASDQSALPVSGTVTATFSGSLPAGTNNVGKVDVNVLPATFAEDSAHASGDLGTFILAVRNDGGSVLAGTTGDYIPVTTDNTGALRVTGGGGGSQYAEDVASVGAENMTLAGAIRQDAPAATTSTDGDYANLKTDSLGRLWVNPAGGVGTPTNASGQATISNSSATVVAARATRRGVLVKNLQTVAIYVDAAGGTATTSKSRLDPGAAQYYPVASLITAITSAAYTASPADAVVHFDEYF